MKTGRNALCPCGSGKKYKRCCLAKDAAAASTARVAQHPTAAASKSPLRLPSVPADLADDLDAASNGVVDLIHAGKLDEAELAARDLLLRFPEVHDGYDRLGMVCEARGDTKQAATYYRKVVEFIQQNPEGYDPELQEVFQQHADRIDPPPANS